jgi:hypothetical protein
MYVKKLEIKKEEILTDKPLKTNHRTLMLTSVVVVGLSILIGVGFAYMGYTSGHFSEAYVLCKNDVLSERLDHCKLSGPYKWLNIKCYASYNFISNWINY